jgi:hypothetical protein
VDQPETFIDSFVNNCAAEMTWMQIFFRLTKELASFTKAQFQTIIDALGKKLVSALPRVTLVKTNESAEHW